MVAWNDIITILMLLVSIAMMIVAVRTLNRNGEKDDTANTERLVRIEDQTKGTATEVIKINCKLDEHTAAQHALETRVTVLEKAQKDDSVAQWKRIDECREDIDEIKTAHYKHVGEGTD